MRLFIGQDWHGNVHVTDDRDALPPDLTDFHEVYLPDYARFAERVNAVLNIQVRDYYGELINLATVV